MTHDYTPTCIDLCRRLLDVCFQPPERLKPSEWAERYRRLSAEASSKKGGQFSFKDAPWQREPMDAIDDQTVESVVLMWASQVTGKTETINNMIGSKIDLDPCPMLVIQPNEKPMAETWSKDRLATMARDTPRIRKKIRDPRSRDSGNTMLHKCFPGGHITVAGANSPASLASRPIRMVFFDEVDRYPASAGTEGDPILLAEKRTESFPDAVTVKTSTPTIKGVSRIEKEFNESDKRYWFCPCPKCGHWQTLRWEQVDWSKHGTPDDPRYICENTTCGAALHDEDRQAMVRLGEWRSTAPFRGVRGYHINGLYCLFRPRRTYKTRLAQMVSAFQKANSKGVETLKVWWNTFKAETWEDPSEKPPEAQELFERREEYLTRANEGWIMLPSGVLVLVAGGDVQEDRIELEVLGVGVGEESWGVENIIVAGNTAEPYVWEKLDEILQRKYRHPCGTDLQVACALFDRRFRGKHVDDFTRTRNSRRIYSCYGNTTPGTPVVSAITRTGPRRTPAIRVGTDTAKGIIYARLKIQNHGPRHCHFPAGDFGYDIRYFEQLTEEREITEYKQGVAVRKWVNPHKRRNEAIDKRVYALAAVEVLKPNFEAIARNMKVTAPAQSYELKKPETETTTTPQPKPEPRPQVRRRTEGRGFVGRWR